MAFPLRAPLGVTATIELTDKVTLSWDAVSGASTYNVYKSSTPNTAGATLLASGVAATSYDDTTLDEEEVRYYFVIAVGGAGSSNYSGMATGWRVMPAPDAPVISGSGEAGFVFLTWEHVARALFYEVYRDGGFIARVPLSAAGGGSTFEYEDTSVTPHTPYDYQVKAGNFTALTGSNTLLDIEADDPVPEAPDDVVATDGTHPSKVVVSWSAVPYADEYDVYRDGSLLASAVAATSYDDVVASGTSYTYKVKARGESGTSGFSNEDTGYAAALAAPSGVSATDGDLDKVTVSWSAVTGATKYHVKRDGAYIATDLVTLSFDDTTATTGTTYSYQVQAENTVEASALSTADNGTRPQIADPATVSATDDDETGVTVTWASVTDATSYSVFRDGTLLSSGITSPLEYFDNSGSDCVIYSYSVKAVRGSNVSPGAVADNGHKLPTGDLCANGGGNSTTTGQDANDGYVFCGNPTVSWAFNAYTAADSFQIYLDGGLIVDLNNVTGTHSGSFGVGGGSGVHTLQVVVTHGTGSTQWDYTLSC